MKCILVISTIFLLGGCFSRQPDKTGYEGKVIPSIIFHRLDNQPKFNTNQIPEGPFVLMYYSPRCPYSKAQISEIIENMDQLKNTKFYFITPYSPKEAKHIREEFELNKYPNIMLGCDSINFIGIHFNVRGFPFTCFYDRHKKLQKAFAGKLSLSEIREQINL